MIIPYMIYCRVIVTGERAVGGGVEGLGGGGIRERETMRIGRV